MPRKITIDGVTLDAIEEEEARIMGHDSVPPPSKDQREHWIRQLEEEEEARLPFTDDEED